MEITVNFTSHIDVSTSHVLEAHMIYHQRQIGLNDYELVFSFNLLSQNLISFSSSFLHLELTKVAALCEVQGMNSPLVLGIVASKTKKLSVSVSLPSVW